MVKIKGNGFFMPVKKKELSKERIKKGSGKILKEALTEAIKKAREEGRIYGHFP